MIAPQLLELLQAWRASEDAYGTAGFEPAASAAERSIIAALNHAKRANLILLIDDLTSALSHVDGCMAAHDAREAARAALQAAGVSVYCYQQMQELADETSDPALEVHLQGRADYLREMGE